MKQTMKTRHSGNPTIGRDRLLRGELNGPKADGCREVLGGGRKSAPGGGSFNAGVAPLTRMGKHGGGRTSSHDGGGYIPREPF